MGEMRPGRVRKQYLLVIQAEFLNVRHVSNTSHPNILLRNFHRRAGNRPKLSVPLAPV